MIAVGVDEDERRGALSAPAGHSEAGVFGMNSPRSLADRSLRGLKLVVADAHDGLRAGARGVFDGGGVKQGIRWINRCRNRQRYRVHQARKASADVPPESRAATAAMPKTISARERKAEAETRKDAPADALCGKQDRPCAMMDASREDILPHMGRPFAPQSIRWIDRRPRRSGANAPGSTGRRSPARRLRAREQGSGARILRRRRSAGGPSSGRPACPPRAPTTTPSSFAGLKQWRDLPFMSFAPPKTKGNFGSNAFS